MTSVAVLIPVLGRPERAAAVAASVRESDERATPFFLCSRGDSAEVEACAATGEPLTVVPWEAGPGDWARKINLGFHLTYEYEWKLLAADDLRFHPGWFDACLQQHIRSRACVIGTNDMGNPRVIAGHHSTHPLVHRDYLECGTADEDGVIMHSGYIHQFCNPPEAPIWMSDCSFKAIGDVEVGEQVVGWTYDTLDRPTVGIPLRTMCYSEVKKVSERTAPLVRVEMASGRSFRCTADHRWLNACWNPSQSGTNYSQWVTPQPGRTLLHVIDPPPSLPSHLERAAGWLGGLYDGEGSGFVIGQNYRNNPEVIQRLHEYLTLTGLTYSYVEQENGMATFALGGGRQGYLNFLLTAQPSRRRQLQALIIGWRARGSSRSAREPIGARRFGHRDKIVAVEPDGEGDVVSLTTTSGNYVAWGYASRNCDDEFVQTAMVRRTFSASRNAYVEHLHPNWGKGADDETYRRGQAGFDHDRALYERRKHLWLS